jgi:hypothetical protein
MAEDELAGKQGFEPRYRGPEPRVLPLDDFEVMPSPVRDRPGLLLRDPFGYTSAVFVIPPP